MDRYKYDSLIAFYEGKEIKFNDFTEFYDWCRSKRIDYRTLNYEVHKSKKGATQVIKHYGNNKQQL